MRNNIISQLLNGDQICFFRAFRYSAGRAPPNRRLCQHRSYQTSRPSLRPAQATAVARDEAEEEANDGVPTMLRTNAVSHLPEHAETPAEPAFRPPNPYESMPDWQCACGHVNLSNRRACTMCYEVKPRNPRLFYPKTTPDKRIFVDSKPAQNWPTASTGGRSQLGYKETSKTQDHGSIINEPGHRFGGFGTMSGSVSRRIPSQPREEPDRYQRTNGRSGLADVINSTLSGTRPFANRRTAPNNAERDSGRGGSRFGSFMDSLSKTSQTAPRDRPSTVSQHQPQRASNSPGMGVFGLQELEQAATTKSRISGTPGRTAFGRDGPGRHSRFDASVPRPERRNRSESDDTRNIGIRPFRPAVSPLTDRTIPEIVRPATSTFDPEIEERRKSLETLDREKRRSLRFELEDDEITPPAQSMADQRQRRAPARRRVASYNASYDLDELGYGDKPTKKKKNKAKTDAPARTRVQLPDFISVEKLARALRVKVDEFIQKLEEEGFEGPRYDHILDAENSAMFAELYGFEPTFGAPPGVEDLVARPPAADKSLLPPRPPIVTIMGHVDHGKTTILDWLRKSNVVAGEHGGITQHIGAFSVTMPGTERQITFLDTPGHAAFLDMRRRGAHVTDIVVLVVAADDSVKPQTIEAIKHALEARVQIIVAINKVDKADANVERVKQDLARHEITVEDYGGEYQAIAVSGKTGKGMEELEEAIITLADVSDFRAETDGQSEGWIIESTVTAAGRVATVLVRRGTMRVGDYIVAGTTWARIRTLRNDAGQLVKEARPGTPVQVDGWRGEDPSAGLEVIQAENEEHAKSVVDLRLERAERQRTASDTSTINEMRSEEADARAKVLAWEAEQEWAARRKHRRPKDNEGWVEGTPQNPNGPKQVHFVIKADVAGSVEALVVAVSAVGNNEITAHIVHSGTGPVSEWDIKHLAAGASATGEPSYAISFNQPIDGAMYRLAEAAGVPILDHNVIYKVTDDVKAKLASHLPPLITHRVLGEAEIGQVFDITVKKGKLRIAGCKVANGVVAKNNKVKVLRKRGEEAEEVVYTGTLESLKNIKKDVAEMRKGGECGVAFDGGWMDFEVGDRVQCFEEVVQARVLY